MDKRIEMELMSDEEKKSIEYLNDFKSIEMR